MVDAVAIAGHVRSLLHGDADAKARAAWELQNLMVSTAPLQEEHRNWIARAGAIPLLVDLLQSGGEGTRWAAAALADLACKNADNTVAIAAAGGIAPLVELVRSGSDRAKVSAAFALSILAWNADNKVAIAAAGAIAPLIEVVRSGCADAKASAAMALRNLAYYNADNKVAIVAAGAVAPLVALTRSGGKGAKTALLTLAYLARNNVDNEVLELERAPLVLGPRGRGAVLLRRRARDEAAAGDDDVAVLEAEQVALAGVPAAGLEHLDAEVAEALARRERPHLGEGLAPAQVGLHGQRQLRHALEGPVAPARLGPDLGRQPVHVVQARLDVGHGLAEQRVLVSMAARPRRHGRAAGGGSSHGRTTHDRLGPIDGGDDAAVRSIDRGDPGTTSSRSRRC
jgi:hypothetical protein